MNEDRRCGPTTIEDQRASLLAAVLKDPDDVQARLVYADILESLGDPRGELIIVQCALDESRYAMTPEDEQRASGKRDNVKTSPQNLERFHKRERELLSKYQRRWTSMADAPGAVWGFKRGFVEYLSIDGSDFVAGASAIFAVEPVVTVHLRGVRGNADLIGPLSVPEMRRVRCLQLSREAMRGESGRVIANAETLESLRELDCSPCSVNLACAIMLAESSRAALPSLETLRISQSWMGDAGVAALVSSETLALTTLDLQRNQLSARACVALADANESTGDVLRHLDLSKNPINNAGAAAILGDRAEKKLNALETLNLSDCQINNAAVEAILASTLARRIRKLDLSRNAFSRNAKKRIVETLGEDFVVV